MDLPSPDPSTLPPAAAPDAEVFQHYRILRRPDGTLWELGRGAMGVTYKAVDENLRVPVALKVVSPHALTDDTARARFVREARAAARLRHRHVAAVHHLGQDESGGYFYAMEFVDGETLEHHVRHHGPLPPGRALALVAQVARALGAAHREGLVHRDIKPANLMVMPDEDEEGGLLLKVIDFGLARAAAPGLGVISGAGGPAMVSGGLSGVTQAGFVGTPLFASPEQLEERPDVDIRSDVYSVGVTLWYLLSARPPFTGSLAGIISQHLTREPPWEQLEDRLPGPLHPALRELLTHLLEKDRERRPADPAALRRALESCRRALPPDPEDPAPEDPTATGYGSQPVARAVLAGRYRLDKSVGEGSSGRVFRARDLSRGGTLVAVKVFHADLFASDDAGEGDLEETLSTLAKRVRAAGHPNLLGVRSFGREGVRRFMVSEWLRGFSLDALLRRRGALAADEALLLLDQVAAAFDHARGTGLPARRLELGVHGVMVHFPDAPASEPVEVPAGPLRNWPTFLVKVDPLGIGREAGDPLLTWTGERTLVPALTTRRPARDTQSSIRGLRDGGASPSDGAEIDDPASDFAEGLRGLGALAYALFGGSPGGTTNLPALSESANAVLRRVRRGGGATAFQAAREFVAALHEGAPEPGADTVIGPLNYAAAPATPTARVPTRTPTRPRTLAVNAPLPPPEPVAARLEETLPFAGDATSSIAHLIDPAPESARRPAALAVLVLLSLAGALAAGIWWGVPVLRREIDARLAAGADPTPGTVAKSRPHLPAASPASRSTPKPVATPTPLPPVADPVVTVTPAPTPNPTPVATPTPTPAAPPERRVPVRFTSEPSGAEITLRGELLGVTPLPTSLPPGEYTARARYGDWPESTRTFRVPARGVTAVDVPFRLRPPGGDTMVLRPDALPTPRREPDAPGPVRRRGAVDDPTPDAYPETPALPAIPIETDGANQG